MDYVFIIWLLSLQLIIVFINTILEIPTVLVREDAWPWASVLERKKWVPEATIKHLWLWHNNRYFACPQFLTKSIKKIPIISWVIGVLGTCFFPWDNSWLSSAGWGTSTRKIKLWPEVSKVQPQPCPLGINSWRLSGNRLFLCWSLSKIS